jgi:hypothetical protein
LVRSVASGGCPALAGLEWFVVERFSAKTILLSQILLMNLAARNFNQLMIIWLAWLIGNWTILQNIEIAERIDKIHGFSYSTIEDFQIPSLVSRAKATALYQ